MGISMPKTTSTADAFRRGRRFTLARYIRENLRRRPARTALSIAGIAICVAFFVLIAALSQGLHAYTLGEVESNREGFVQLTRDDESFPFFTEKELETLDTAADSYLNTVGTGGTIYPFLRVDYARDTSQRFGEERYSLVAIDGEKGYYNGELIYDRSSRLFKGKHLAEAAPALPAVVLGYSLWQQYFAALEPGDHFNAKPPSNISWLRYEYTNGTLQPYPYGADEYPRLLLFGILAPNYRTDQLAFVQIEFFTDEIGLIDPATEERFIPQAFLVFPDATDVDYDLLIATLDAAVDITGYDNEERAKDAVRQYLAFERTVNGWLFVVITVISLITALSISNTMIMSVMERMRELATLRALGITRRGMVLLIVTEAMILCAIAIAIGGGSGALLAWLFNMNYRAGTVSLFFAPALINGWVVAGALGLPALFGTLAAIYPGWRAARVEPCAILR